MDDWTPIGLRHKEDDVAGAIAPRNTKQAWEYQACIGGSSQIGKHATSRRRYSAVWACGVSPRNAGEMVKNQAQVKNTLDVGEQDEKVGGDRDRKIGGERVVVLRGE